MRVSVFSTKFVETFFILSRTERDTIKNVYWSSCNVPIILVRFYWTWNFSTYFRKIPYQISWKPVQREPICSTHTEGRTDVMKLIVACRKFANAPKNLSVNVVQGNTALCSEILAKHLDRVDERKEGYLNTKLVAQKVSTGLYSNVITQ